MELPSWLVKAQEVNSRITETVFHRLYAELHVCAGLTTSDYQRRLVAEELVEEGIDTAANSLSFLDGITKDFPPGYRCEEIINFHNRVWDTTERHTFAVVSAPDRTEEIVPISGSILPLKHTNEGYFLEIRPKESVHIESLNPIKTLGGENLPDTTLYLNGQPTKRKLIKTVATSINPNCLDFSARDLQVKAGILEDYIDKGVTTAPNIARLLLDVEMLTRGLNRIIN